ncbi:MAG: type II secretion system F family protein [Pseudomonadota bacterium]
MPSYRYRAVASDGAIVEGVAVATDTEGLGLSLQARGETLLRATAPRSPRRFRMTRPELQLWLEQLQVLVSAGLPLLDALNHCATDSSAAGQASRQLSADLERGMTLSQAMAEQPRNFSALVTALVQAGEVTGTLDHALHTLHALSVQRSTLATRMRKAIAYPAFTLLVLLVSAPVLISVLVPQLMSVLALTDATIPWYTRALIVTADTVSAHGLTLVLSAVTLCSLIWASLKLSSQIAAWVSKMTLHLPWVGPALRLSQLAFACRQLAAMHQSGLVIHEALMLVAQGVSNAHLRACVRDVAEGVSRGQLVHQSFAATSAVPPLMISLIKTGELSGRLDHTLMQAAKVFEFEAERRVDRLVGALGPCVLLCAVCLLTWFIAALFLPLYSSLFALGGEL